MPVITHVIDSRDGVFIEGKHLHNTFKPMTNNELTLDRLTAMSGGVRTGKVAIAGGVAMRADGSTCNDRFTWKNKKDILGGGNDNAVLVKNVCTGLAR